MLGLGTPWKAQSQRAGKGGDMDASDANDSGERCGSGKGRGDKASDGSYVGGGADWVGGIRIARDDGLLGLVTTKNW
jgi:hypothetical protein